MLKPIRSTILSLATLTACGGEIEQEPKEPFDYETFAATALSEITEKQTRLSEDHGFGSWHEFGVDLATGTMEFKREDGSVGVRADVTPIGSFNESSSTWQWFWSNTALPDDIRARCETLKNLEQRTGKSLFTEAKVELTKVEADQLVAISVQALDARGYYRAKSGTSDVFLAIDKVTPVPE